MTRTGGQAAPDLLRSELSDGYAWDSGGRPLRKAQYTVPVVVRP
jgi:hypothetical protein